MDREVFDLNQSLTIRKENKISEANRHLKNKVNDDYINDSLWFGDKSKENRLFVTLYKIFNIFKPIVTLLSILVVISLVYMFLDVNNFENGYGYPIHSIYLDSFRLLSFYLIFIGIIMLVINQMIPYNWKELLLQFITIILCLYGIILIFVLLPRDSALPEIFDLVYNPFGYGKIYYTMSEFIPWLPSYGYFTDLEFESFTRDPLGPLYLISLVVFTIYSKVPFQKNIKTL